MLDYNTDRTEILKRIEQHHSLIKVVLKTRDDDILLSKWYEHHSALVGEENLIIVDNGSQKASVLDFYEQIGNRSVVFSYREFFDNLHRVEAMPQLYASLRKSAEYYAFIDTDEFLFVHANDRLVSSQEAIKTLLGTCGPSNEFIPGIWLHNYPGSSRHFFISDSTNRIIEAIRWGKPIISARHSVAGVINHNCQIANCLTNSMPVYGLYVAHLNRLQPKQRISANVAKLIALGVINDESDVSRVLSSENFAQASGNVKLYLNEIEALRPIERSGWPPLTHVPQNCMAIENDGSLVFADAQAAKYFSMIAAEFANDCKRAFTK